MILSNVIFKGGPATDKDKTIVRPCIVINENNRYPIFINCYFLEVNILIKNGDWLDILFKDCLFELCTFKSMKNPVGNWKKLGRPIGNNLIIDSH